MKMRIKDGTRKTFIWEKELAVHYDYCPAEFGFPSSAGKSEMMSQLLLGHIAARRVILSRLAPARSFPFHQIIFSRSWLFEGFLESWIQCCTCSLPLGAGFLAQFLERHLSLDGAVNFGGSSDLPSALHSELTFRQHACPEVTLTPLQFSNENSIFWLDGVLSSV